MGQRPEHHDPHVHFAGLGADGTVKDFYFYSGCAEFNTFAIRPHRDTVPSAPVLYISFWPVRVPNNFSQDV